MGAEIVADLGDIGAFINAPPVQQAFLTGFVFYRAGGMVIVISPSVGRVVQLTTNGVPVDRRASVGGDVEFFDLEPGNYIATTTLGTGTGTTWSVIVTPTTYTVTRITSTAVQGAGAFG